MKKILLAFLIVFVFAGLRAQNIVLLHTNDLHSKLNGYAPEIEYSPLKTGNDNTKGGFARIAALIENEKKDNKGDIVLTVDAGDFLMGSLFHTQELNTGFQLGLMKKMGYDYLSIGNHEFDYGPEALVQIINNGRENTDIPQLILTNVEFDPDDSRDDELQKLYEEGVIKKYAIHEEKGVKIALLGIMGEDAREVQPYLSPVKITNPYRTAKKTAKDLKKSGIADFVVILSHSGIIKEDGDWGGEDVKLAKKTSKYVDAIISGHTHMTTKNEFIEDGVPVVQTGTGGKNLGYLSFVKTDYGYELDKFDLLEINDEIQGDLEIQKLIDQQEKLVTNNLLADFNIKYNEAVFETSFNLSSKEDENLDKSNLGPLLSDAIYHEINSSNIHTDISILAAGVIRAEIESGTDGKQSIADIFRVFPLGQGQDDIPGYSLAQIYLTSKEIKNLMEILLMIRESHTSNHCFFSGARIYVDFDKGLLNKVQKIKIGNEKSGFKEIDISKKNNKLYAISANAYMLEFLGMIKKKTFGLVKVKPKLKDGSKLENIRDAVIDFDPEKEGIQEGKEWLAFYHFVQTFEDKNENDIPDIPDKYRNKNNPIIKIKKD